MDWMRRGTVLSVAAAALMLVACGSSPTAPSGSGGVVVRGVLLGEGATFTASSTDSASSGGTITVVVEGTSISTTISGNGTFELEGLTPGTFTLVFLQNDAEIGRVTVTAGDGFEVKIVVTLEDSVVVLVDLELDDPDQGDDDGDNGDKTCMIDGGRVGSRIELEGNVVSANGTTFTMTTEGNRASGTITVSASGASFKCNGDSKSNTQCKASAGAKVHVRGTLTACSTTQASVTATEVKVQKSGNDEDDD